MLSLMPAFGAIAAGNTVVLKPCVISRASARLMAKLVNKYMDPSVMTCVGTEEDRDRYMTAALLKEKTDFVFFTGSPSVGKRIYAGAATHLAGVCLELGGKNPTIIDATADIEMAAKTVVWGRNMNSGQQCISPDYVLIERSVMEPFIKAACGWVKKLYGEKPENNGNFGKIVGEKQWDSVTGMLDSIVKGGHGR